MALLYGLMPQKFPSPLCPLCTTERDSLLHFFFTCPLIQKVWTMVAVRFFDSAWAPIIHFFLSDMWQIVSRLTDLPLKHLTVQKAPAITPPQIAACALQNIWSSRWQTIFEDTPFIPSVVAKKIGCSILRLHDEEEL
ncbi:hypothetical protein BY458DRAFT_510942 [Sporodiniella umbellata]|nr:hypothetical protein BY458DRAFT_510942 [Sporodiniella umbellata]